MTDPIYLDYAATTPCDPRVAGAMWPWLGEAFGNPASPHAWGARAAEAVARARGVVAQTLRCCPAEVVWTSGATESNNLAVLGAARYWAKRKRHVITSAIEHHSVLDACAQLEKEGFTVTYLAPEASGCVSPQRLAAALRDDTCLVSLMWVNNELGSINAIAELGALVRAKGALMHVDAAQACGRLPIDFSALPVDLMSLSAHKFYGPKGIGALLVRGFPRAQLQPLMYGGGQEHGLRPGTLATHQIVGFASALAWAEEDCVAGSARISGLRERLLEGLMRIPGMRLNGDPTRCVPHIVNVGWEGLNSESLLLACRALALASASACTMARGAVSHVLKALGYPDRADIAALRISLGRATSGAEVDEAVAVITQAVTQLRHMAGDLPAEIG
jgi:cysteine desulfurase